MFGHRQFRNPREDRLDAGRCGPPGEVTPPDEEEPPEPPSRGVGPEGPEHSGFIVVRLSPDVPRPGEGHESIRELAEELQLEGLRRVLDEYDLGGGRRVVRALPPERILELEREATRTDLPPLRSLTSYWRIDVRGRPEQVDEITARLNQLFEVDRAYRELAVSEPVVNAGDDPYNGTQDYLDAAPDGIDARWAWTQPSGEGAGISFVDLEQGWFLTHEDFAGKSPGLLYGDNRDGVGAYDGDHGTAVLGEVIADDNTVGVVGIAPSLASADVTSHFDAGTNTNLHVADAILGALPSLDPGDVLLLEVQRGAPPLPTETDDADFDAIRLAVAHGVVIVEAAGNGNNDLDAYTDGAGDAVLDRGDPDFRDSGAVMVGAGASNVPHDRLNFSNFGSRLDCYAWGENVTTCGYGDLDAGGGDDETYTDSFGGTSSASPIVAGAAILLQGMHEGNTGARLSPLQMRSLLSDPATGTAQGPNVAGDIGVMPDLQAIANNTLGVVPDVYVRDAVGDTGAVPFGGSISASPDVIVRPSPVADGQAAFGQGSGTENSNTLGHEAEAGQDNSIYVRMRNRGAAPATGVTADVYWSEVATLVTPDSWTLIGTTPPVDVPVGDVLTVADPVTWGSADIPGTGHYCFVAILDHAGDPAPPVPPATDWDDFRTFIRAHNNVTWRNFNVVDLDPDAGGDPSVLPFVLAGAPDRARRFDVELIRQLGDDVRLWLELPLAAARPFLEGRNWKFELDREEQVARLLLPAAPRICVPGVRLGKGARHRSKFLLEGGEKAVRPGHRVAIRQLYARQEVGRVTWMFHDRREERELAARAD